jgi:iron(III) transport system ATP-binding protein
MNSATKASGGARVRLDGIAKRFGATVAVDSVSLIIEPGEFLTLLGPSGCGKTTTLRVVAGLEEPTAGRVFIDGEDVTDRPPHARDITMVFQSYALFPHLTVFENVAYGLRVLRRPADEVRHRVSEALALTGIGDLGARPPSALSGGQQQRTALARALVLQPKVLLFDEPLSNLDAKLRRRMRDEIRALQRRAGITALYVTHDQAEALAVSDRIAVMAGGRVEQLGAPAEIYRRPATRFVADFIGEANLLPAEIVAHGPSGARARLGSVTVPVADGAPTSGPATLVVRPEAIQIRPAASGPSPDGALAGQIRQAAFLGAAAEYTVDTEVGVVAVTDALMAEGFLPAGARVWLTVSPDRLAVLPAGPPASPGEAVS